MIVLVTGGRDYADIDTVRWALAALTPRPTLLIHGAAAGADSLASAVARELGIPTEAHPADWRAHGRGAGPLRNQLMVDRRPDLLLAFPAGRGTADCVRRARAAGITVRLVSASGVDVSVDVARSATPF